MSRRIACLFFLFVFLSVPAFADDEQYTESVTVTASLEPIEIEQTGSSVTVYDDAHIRERELVFLADLLRTAPGIAVSRAGAGGSFTQLRMRGGEANHILVSLDGVPIQRCLRRRRGAARDPDAVRHRSRRGIAWPAERVVGRRRRFGRDQPSRSHHGSGRPVRDRQRRLAAGRRPHRFRRRCPSFLRQRCLPRLRRRQHLAHRWRGRRQQQRQRRPALPVRSRERAVRTGSHRSSHRRRVRVRRHRLCRDRFADRREPP